MPSSRSIFDINRRLSFLAVSLRS